METPTCPNCGTKFPGDPCKKCSMTAGDAEVKHSTRMPSQTRKRRKHGRQS